MIPLIIQDQFYTIQNLQRSPIPQTGFSVLQTPLLGDRFCAFKLIICPKRASSDQIFAKHNFVQCCRLLSTACYCSYALPGGSNDRREKKKSFSVFPLYAPMDTAHCIDSPIDTFQDFLIA